MSEPLFVLGRRRDAPFGRSAPEVLTSVDDVRHAYAEHPRARWVVLDAALLALLPRAIHAHDRWHRVLLLDRTSAARRELLHALFRVVIAPDDDARLLPPDETADVMADPHAEDLFIGGVVDSEDEALVLYRGDLDCLVVPFRWFRSRARKQPIDFDAFAVTDSGQTVRLGDYEVATDAILYEFDADARRRMKAREIEHDPSFGRALHRLRLERRLARSDFAPLNAKTIARIERGEVEEPHGETLAIIAKKLGVKAEAIRSY